MDLDSNLAFTIIVCHSEGVQTILFFIFDFMAACIESAACKFDEVAKML